MSDVADLLEGLRAGEERSIARAISILEDRRPGHRELAADLHRSPGDARVLGVTGSPGVGKSTLVDGLVAALRDRGETVGVVAVDPASPFTGGALLGDRVRLRSRAEDDGVFVRSMSARGASGGLAAGALDAVRVLSAAGTDVVIVETVGVGQTEVDLVGTADTVLLVTQPAAGDDVQALKAGLLEIGDAFVVNKADRPDADRTVRELREMIDGASAHGSHRASDDATDLPWTPPVLETVATEGTGLPAVLETVDDHREFLERTGLDERAGRRRRAEEIRTHLRTAVEDAVDARIEEVGGIEGLVRSIEAGEADPHAIADRLLTDAAETTVESSPEREP